MSHAYLCGSALRVALELRNSQPQSVLRFCVLSGQNFFAFGSSLWLRFARCVARSVIVVAGKLASILICGLAAELRNSQPQSILRFCVFGGQGFLGSEEIGSFLPKKLNLFWFWPIHIFYRGKHVLILTISMQTWQFLLRRV